MAIYNLSEYSDDYSMTSGSLLNYYRDEIYDDENKNNDANNRMNNSKATTSKCFEYKAKIIGSTPNNLSRLKQKLLFR